MTAYRQELLRLSSQARNAWQRARHRNCTPAHDVTWLERLEVRDGARSWAVPGSGKASAAMLLSWLFTAR
jgi:hypothetical protein